MAVVASVGTDRASRYRRAMEGLFIRSERGHTIPMRFSDSQELLWTHIAPRLNRRQKLWFIVLKGRQVYVSTFFQALTFVRTLEQPGTHSMVLAQDLHTSHKLFEIAKRFHDHLPLPKLRPAHVNELVFPFPQGTSRYHVVSAGTVAKGRGTTQSCVHASEVAFWPHAEIMTGLFQAMPDLDDTIWVLESTANGMAGDGLLFYEEWNRAVREESELLPVFIPWFAMPKYRRTPGILPDDWDDEERLLVATYGGLDGLMSRPLTDGPINHAVCGEQLAWRRYAIKTKTQGSMDNFNQEFPSSPEDAFIASGQPAFDRLALLHQRQYQVDPVWRGTVVNGKLAEQDRGEVRLWEHPKGGEEYVIGADTAEGLAGGDYACAEILNMRTLEQVGSIHGTIPFYEFSQLLNVIGRYFNRALLCIEVYPQGHTVQDYLIRQLYYPHLHRWRGKPDRAKLGPMRMYGWETNVWSRPLLIGAGQRAINHRLVTVHEAGLVDELLLFSKNDNGKYEAEVGHDDRVIALLLALRSREENYVDRKAGPVLSQEMPLPSSIRVAEARDATADARKRLSKVLRTKARDAVKHWMRY